MNYDSEWGWALLRSTVKLIISVNESLYRRDWRNQWIRLSEWISVNESMNQTGVNESMNKTGVNESMNQTGVNESRNQTGVNESMNRCRDRCEWINESDSVNESVWMNQGIRREWMNQWIAVETGLNESMNQTRWMNQCEWINESDASEWINESDGCEWIGVNESVVRTDVYHDMLLSRIQCRSIAAFCRRAVRGTSLHI